MQLKYKLTKPCLDNAEVEAVHKVFESGWLAEGEVTEAFERKVANYIGAKYAIAVSNCTIALELCLKAQEKRSQIAIPDFTHPATIRAVLNTSSDPVLFDVGLGTYNAGVETYPLETIATIPVSLFGLDVLPFYYPIVEDAACSFGAGEGSYKVGNNWTHPVCFSFHPRKLITTGEGGMITTNDEELAQRLRRMKNFGVGGGNYKFDDVRASIGLAQMDKLEGIIELRIRMAKVYDDLLSTSQDIIPPQKMDGVRHTYQTYAVYLKKGNRNEVINKLAEQGIESQRGAYALHLLPEYEQCKKIGDLHNSELLHHNLLALPMAYDITEEEQKFVIERLTEACNH